MHYRSIKSLKLAVGFIVNWHDNSSNQLTKLNGQQVDINVMHQAVNACNNSTPRYFRRAQQTNINRRTVVE